MCKFPADYFSQNGIFSMSFSFFPFIHTFALW